MPSGMKRMTFENSLETKDRALESAVFFHRLMGVGGTGGQKATMPAEHWRKRYFVRLDQQKQRFFHFNGS